MSDTTNKAKPTQQSNPKITRSIRPVSIQFGGAWYRAVARDENGQITIRDSHTQLRIDKSEIDALIDALFAMKDEPQ